MGKCKTVVLGGFMAVDLLRGKSADDISNIGKATVINKKKKGGKEYVVCYGSRKVRSFCNLRSAIRRIAYVDLNSRDYFMQRIVNYSNPCCYTLSLLSAISWTNMYLYLPRDYNMLYVASGWYDFYRCWVVFPLAFASYACKNKTETDSWSKIFPLGH